LVKEKRREKKKEMVGDEFFIEVFEEKSFLTFFNLLFAHF